jgi:hypothetical protein
VLVLVAASAKPFWNFVTGWAFFIPIAFAIVYASLRAAYLLWRLKSDGHGVR